MTVGTVVSSLLPHFNNYIFFHGLFAYRICRFEGFEDVRLECLISPYYLILLLGVVNGKSETHQDAKTGILESEPETKKAY